MRLREKVAVMTGGAGGIGKAISLSFARQGARVAPRINSTANRLRYPLGRLDDKQCASIFHQIPGLRADLHHAPGALGIDGREQLHDFDNA